MKKLFAAIGNFLKILFAAIGNFLKILFGNTEKWINDNVTPSIQVVNNIKAIVDSPIAMVLTSIIPGQFDDLLRAKLSSGLQIAIDRLTNIYDITNESDEVIKLDKFTQWLKTLTPDTKNAIYKKIASILSRANDIDATVKEHAIDLLVQTTYSKLKEDGHLDELTTPDEVETINKEDGKINT